MYVYLNCLRIWNCKDQNQTTWAFQRSTSSGLVFFLARFWSLNCSCRCPSYEIPEAGIHETLNSGTLAGGASTVECASTGLGKYLLLRHWDPDVEPDALVPTPQPTCDPTKNHRGLNNLEVLGFETLYQHIWVLGPLETPDLEPAIIKPKGSKDSPRQIPP